MTPHSSSRGKRWPHGHLFLFLWALLASACAHAPQTASHPSTRATTTTSACTAPPLPVSDRFTFTQFASGLPRAGQWRNRFDLADMNGDGDIDLVHGPARKGNPQPAIFLGNGMGQFTRWSTVHFPPLPYDYGDAKAADFNRDGLVDLALGVHLRGLTVLVHEGDGHYAPYTNGLALRAPAGGAEPPFSSRAIAVVDWNGDRYPDLLALNEGPDRFAPSQWRDSLLLLLNRGDAWQRAEATGAAGLFGDALAVGDVDGDGDADAMAGSNVAGARSLLYLGEGESWRVHELQSLPDRGSVTAIALRDRDGDRRDEIFDATLFVDGEQTCVAIDVTRFHGTRDEAARLFAERSADSVVALLATDVDGDRRLDLLAVRRSGAMLYFAGTAEGFTRRTDVPAPPSMQGCEAFDAHAADLDRDGAQEVIVSFAGELTPGNVRPCRGGGGFVTWRVGSR